MIVMAGYGDDELVFALMAAGAYDYLPKPFTASELILTLRKAEYREAQRSAESLAIAASSDLPPAMVIFQCSSHGSRAEHSLLRPGNMYH